VVAKKLDVSVPSHCELLSQQAKQLAASMEGVTLKQPKIRYLSGTTARTLGRPEQIGDDLAFNMSRTVDWESTIQAAWARCKVTDRSFAGNGAYYTCTSNI
jgi:malonate decarboxylase epsilon subunit